MQVSLLQGIYVPYILKQMIYFDVFQINFVLALGENEWRFDYLPVITETYPVYSSADKML